MQSNIKMMIRVRGFFFLITWKCLFLKSLEQGLKKSDSPLVKMYLLGKRRGLGKAGIKED